MRHEFDLTELRFVLRFRSAFLGPLSHDTAILVRLAGCSARLVESRHVHLAAAHRDDDGALAHDILFPLAHDEFRQELRRHEEPAACAGLFEQVFALPFRLNLALNTILES